MAIRKIRRISVRARIAIWGAGKFGQYVCGQLKERDNIELVYFIDKNEKMKDYVYFVPYYMEHVFKDRNLCEK